MRILITGSHGFIGSHIAEYYAKESQNSLCLIDNLSRHKHNLFLFDNLSNVEFWQVDLRDYETLKMIVNSFKPEVVIHASGQVAVTTSMVEPYDDFSTNVIGTVNLLECLRMEKFKGKFIFTSTNKVYGDNVNTIKILDGLKRYSFEFISGIPETLNIDRTTHTPYGTSKLCADLYVQEYANTYGFSTAIFRMSCIYGERQYGTEDQGWLAHFILNTLSNFPITIYGDGKQVRDILYVKDLMVAFDSFIKDTKLKGSNIFNIGGGPTNTISLLECLEYLEDIVDTDLTVKFEDWREADQKVYISDITKVSNIFNWKPTVKPKEGILRLIEWFKR